MFGGKFNIGSLLKNAKKIEEMVQQTQEELANIYVNGESGAGLVSVSMNAQHDIKSLNLADELFKEPKNIISELIIAAINDANHKASQLAKEKMMSASSLFSGLANADDSNTKTD